MIVVRTIEELRRERARIIGRLGLVPTMGYLHEGHLALVSQARAECDVVGATIFVNPTQFGPNEDLASYPRDLDRDLTMLETAGVSLVFIPAVDVIYPLGFQTYVNVENVTQRLEGAVRPGHFRGVATVVAKLFNLVQPDAAFFGQKDAQQVVVIRRMVGDLNFPVDIIVCPIVRENDGLALSSRNVYLQPAERQAATVLSQALRGAGAAYDAGERNPYRLREIVKSLIAAEMLAELDYVSLAYAHDLSECEEPTDLPLLLSVAARVGRPRLIDNCLLPLSLNTREGASHVLGAV